MRYALFIFLLACSSVNSEKYSTETNCSQRAKDFLKINTGSHTLDSEKKSAELLISHAPELATCAAPEKKQLCVVLGLDEVGTLRFLDIADEVRGLTPELHKCLTDKFQAIDYSSLKSKNGLDILQRYDLVP
jgi:hypothetical protein